jgi:DNA-binding NarL/FixJ family response regulator
LGAATATLTSADELDDAAAAQDAIIAESQRRGSRPMFLQAATFSALTALFAGDFDVAEDHAQRALDVARKLSAQMFVLQHFSAVMLERGRAHEAACVRRPAPTRRCTVRCADRLDSGEDGLAALREAVAVLERSPARLERVRALVNLGAGLRSRGLREQAREPLSEALDRAGRMGAVALAERARAELIADGLLNREIAQALFLSTRTVEAQLSGAYAKLAIGSRAELADALRATCGDKVAPP